MTLKNVEEVHFSSDCLAQATCKTSFGYSCVVTQTFIKIKTNYIQDVLYNFYREIK